AFTLSARATVAVVALDFVLLAALALHPMPETDAILLSAGFLGITAALSLIAVNVRDRSAMLLEVTTHRLEENEALFRGVAEATPVPLTVSRLHDGHHFYANEAW